MYLSLFTSFLNLNQANFCMFACFAKEQGEAMGSRPTGVV